MIKVYVKKARGKFHFVITYPSGKTKWNVTEFGRRRDAEREAKRIEDKLNIEAPRPEPLSFDQLCWKYDQERLAKRSKDYRTVSWSVLNKIKALTDINLASEIDQSWVNKTIVLLGENLNSPSSIAGYSKSLRAFLNWASGEGLIDNRTRVVLSDGTIETTKSALKVEVLEVDPMEAAGGEALTLAQLKRMIAKAPLVLEAARLRGFEDLIWGYWYTGFRAGEIFNLTWDDKNAPHVEGLDEWEDPEFDGVCYVTFPRNTQKGRRFERWVAPPDLVEHLKGLPGDRTGFVYNPLNLKMQRYRRRDSVGEVLSSLFERAEIEVIGADGQSKKATTKDIRRGFSQRWYDLTQDADAVARLMRHRSFKTTQRFYKKQQAEVFSNLLKSAIQ